MQRLTLIIHYPDNVEIDPILIQDFLEDTYKGNILNIDADIQEEKDPDTIAQIEP